MFFDKALRHNDYPRAQSTGSKYSTVVVSKKVDSDSRLMNRYINEYKVIVAKNSFSIHGPCVGSEVLTG